MKVWEVLEQIQNAVPTEYIFGLCSLVDREFDRADQPSGSWEKHRKECFKAWPEFSGDNVYPIPGYDHYTASRAFDSTSEDEMWNPEHPYGASRLRLLDHTTKWFKERDL